ncbi:transcriptional regulator, AraC family [Cellulophaga algicola DSM 14237]|uniref:Transcriptional regulator, AraC family n=1 Tax=Cellulophaga algicola (strain DSM 14237 / IC166 / ACAM 630) TaxID=688270 RepID=E6X736_CELAD|nr:helix-turn-helix transcriptional regulator [Cellulophaga algicola]ADV47485.1 transcriptional regulator, AraC family [Cellulophaga algicola DSM 14237]
MNLNVLEILVFVSLIQGLLFSVVLLTQKTFRVKANKYLAYSTFLLSYIGVVELLVAKDLDEKYYFIDYFGDDIPWLFLFYIPMLIYFLKSTKNSYAKSKKIWILTGPFFFFWVLYAMIDFQLDFKFLDWDIITNYYRLVYETEFYTSILFNTSLITLSYFIIKKSTISPDEKKWLKNIWAFNAALLFIWVINTFIPEDLYPIAHSDITYPVWLGVSFYVYWLIFRGLLQLKLSQDKSELHELRKGSVLVTKKVIATENSEPSIVPQNNYFQEFTALMTVEKLYRNPEISRDLIAEKLNLSPGYLSQVISAAVDSNFSSLINDYRISDAKQMLLDSDFDKYSVVAIGLEAGFKSKSTFYTAFKKHTGFTPNQFKALKKES